LFTSKRYASGRALNRNYTSAIGGAVTGAGREGDGDSAGGADVGAFGATASKRRAYV